MALGLILFDGGLRTRLATFRNVLAPAGLLATVGVLITAALTAPVAVWALQLNWSEALLVGAVMASTDAAAVFFLLHAKGLRLRPRVSATLEVESGINDPFAIFLTIVLVEILFSGSKSWSDIAALLAEKAIIGGFLGWLGGRAMVLVLNRLVLPQGMHAPFVATGALVTFGLAECAARLGLPRGLYRRPDRRQSRDPRPQHHRDVPRCRHLARADRHVRAARPARLARPAAAAAVAGARRGAGADADRAAGRGADLPRAVPLQLPGEAVHLLGRPARRGVGVPRLDPDAGRIARRALLLRRRLRRGHAVAR